MPTVTRAYALARSGKYRTFESIKAQLKADGFRAVDALLAARSIKSHLQAICAAASDAPRAEAENDRAEASVEPERAA
jgi:hypothetical protein